MLRRALRHLLPTSLPEARGHGGLSSTASLVVTPTYLSLSTTSGSSPSSSRASPSPDWTQHAKEEFSIVPSFFSPLYAAHKRQVDKEIRRKLAIKLLRAHHELSAEAEGYDAAQVTATAMHRISEMQKLAAELRSLPRTNISACSSRSTMLGFYSMLEQETAGHDADAEAFHAMSQGKGSVWQHWKLHFAEQYASSPALESLQSIYARSGQAGGNQLQNWQSQGKTEPHHKHPSLMGEPSISRGVARATGMRKTSTADVRVAEAESQGRIFINGKPLDQALPDVSARMSVLQPLIAAGALGKFDVVAQARGGGPSSMAQAVRHGLAKSLTLLLDNSSANKLNGMTQWDPRRVERKKPGRKKARKGFAYVRR